MSVCYNTVNQGVEGHIEQEKNYFVQTIVRTLEGNDHSSQKYDLPIVFVSGFHEHIDVYAILLLSLRNPDV
jgi:hypothetical protein